MSDARRMLGEILIEMGAVTAQQIESAIEQQLNGDRARLGEIFVANNCCTSADITNALAEQFGMEMVDVGALEIPPEVTSLLSAEFCRENTAIPISLGQHTLTLALADPLNLEIIDNVRFMLSLDTEAVLASADAISEAISKHYESHVSVPFSTEAAAETVQFKPGYNEDDETDIAATDAPVVKLVNLFIAQAVHSRASDIHIEPMTDRLCVRYRIDGVCMEVDAPPKRLQGAIITRVKLMAQLDIAERRRPQDGKIQLRLAERRLDVRVSSLPSAHGESLVLRILDKSAIGFGLDQLGFHDDDSRIFRSLIKKPNGVILITGPTGSGKTTTLYSALNELNTPDRKIITVENPVEYTLDGINQVQVNNAAGMTFQRALKAMLRQAPNIILVGEIRDAETAHIAIEAALTGHLVFATLHTNDAPSALSRLIDMDIAPFLVASAVQAVQAQRLVRMLCPDCKKPAELPVNRLKAAGLREEQFADRVFYRAGGCSNCRDTGYRGRKGIYEIMVMNRRLRELCFQKATLDALRDQARRDGMHTLLEDGLRKVLDGWTTLDEVLGEAKSYA